MNYAIFKSLKNNKYVLEELLINYCNKRRKLYDNLGYSNIVVQSLYDSGSSRKTGKIGVLKIKDLIKVIFSEVVEIKDINELKNHKVLLFSPENKGKTLFSDFCEKYKIEYLFGKSHQGKYPDLIIKIYDDFFILEAKHLKGGGGHQNNTITETIEFIRYPEKSKTVHYISFMDGINNFINKRGIYDRKTINQRKDVVKYLKENKNNYFVNTFGIKQLFSDLK